MRPSQYFQQLLYPIALTQGLSVTNDPQAACERTGRSLDIPNAHVNHVEYVEAGTNISLPTGYNVQSCDYTNRSVSEDICRVTMNVATSNRSEIFLEAWLPTSWSGRFLSTGNGALAGCIAYEDMAYASGFGFATVGANGGHNGTSGEAFLHNEEVLADFVYRSVHTGALVGKEITKAHYGRAHNHSYYLSSSTGGRQGFKEAQDFPDDFDGIVVGTPAIAWNNLTSWAGRFRTVTGPANSTGFLSFDDWALVHKDILRQCDGLDGVTDGLLEDPDFCAYRPVDLQCPRSGNQTQCLTAPQIQTVRAVFEDYYGIDGSLIFPGMHYGSELVARVIYYAGQSFQITQDWYRYAVYNNSDWQPTELSIKDAAYAASLNPLNVDTWEGDLSSFQQKGGRILHWHGLTDPMITSANSERYYNHVSNTMGLAPSDLDEFYRFFRISGLDHYSGGEGAWGIGNNGRVASGGRPQTPANNVLLAMVDWVENGDAPATVTGYKYINVRLLPRRSRVLRSES